MHHLLSQLLEKWNISNVEQLTPEEKQTFDQWRSILNDEVTVDTIAEFCTRQQKLIESKWKEMYRDRAHDSYLTDIHAVYGNIRHLIEADKGQRAQLEQELEKKLDTQPREDV